MGSDINKGTLVAQESKTTLDVDGGLAPEDINPNAIVEKYYYRRWLYLAVYSGLTMFCGPSFFTYTPYQDMFHHDNAYSYLCKPGDEVDDTYHACLAQRQKIAAILPAAVSTMFSFSFAGGILIDLVGPKVAGCVGLCSQILGWVLLACANDSFDGYKVGMIFVAMGIDPLFLSMLSVGNLFPGWSITVISSCLSVARSLAMAVGMVLRPIQNSGLSLRAVCFGYAVFVGVWLVLAMLTLPWEHFPKTTDYVAQREAELANPELLIKEKFSWPKLGRDIKESARLFLKHGFSLSYLPLCFIAIVTFMRNNYFSNSINEQLPKAKSLYEILNVISMLPCPLFGFICDRVAVESIIAVINASGALMLGLLMAKAVWTQYMSAMMSWIHMSYLTSEFFVYCYDRFPQSVYGKLAGFANLVGGNFANVSELMYNWASSHDNFIPFDVVLTVLSVACILVAFGMWAWNVRKINREKSSGADMSGSGIACQELKV